MRVTIGNIILRDFEKKDVKSLYTIVREKEIVRFMRDWSQLYPSMEALGALIGRLKGQNASADIRTRKRYAIALPETDEVIGMVGVGLQDALNEVEAAYFMSEKYQRRGYAREAIRFLVRQCFERYEIDWLILTIDSANEPSCKLAEKCGFTLYEKRTPIQHKQLNIESESYYYYRIYRDS